MLLTAEEIYALDEECIDCHGHNEHDVAKAQLKKVVEWGDERCVIKSHSSYAEPFGQKRHDCPKCWQALLDEVKDAT